MVGVCMTRTRLREAHKDPEEFYRERYPLGYQHTVWPDHVERVEASVNFILAHASTVDHAVADLSCGDGALVRRLLSERDPFRYAICGDINLVYGEVEGPLPYTLDCLPTHPYAVDLYICSETLEHMDDPDELLVRIKERSRALFLSTPVGETADHGNMEHYWSWDTDDIRKMLTDAGWGITAHEVFEPASADTYTFQFWYCT